MKNINIMALSALIALSSNAIASNKMEITESFCFKNNILSTSGYSFEKESKKEIKLCIIETKTGYEIKENSFVYGENKYKITGLDDSDFNNIEKISNINGKLVIKTKSKKIYTGDIGYVLTNREYLPLKENNEIILTKEVIQNVDKVIYSGELIVFSQDKKVYQKNKKTNDWEQLPLRNVIDVTQSRFGSYFVITDTGVFAQLQETDNRTPDPRERGVFYRFDKANIATIPVNSLRFRFVENHKNQNFRLVMDNIKNERETFYVYFGINEALIEKGGKVNKMNEIDYGKPLKKGVVSRKGSRTTANNISIEKVKTSNLGTFESPFITTNFISSKYKGVVELDYKEKFSLLDHPLDQGKVLNLSKIVRVLENTKERRIYVLRSNGLLKTYNSDTYRLLKEEENIKSISHDGKHKVDIERM